MPYKYIGRTIDFKGKSLWEILGNLKNHGTGRIIGRSMFERYKEPCYIKILQVEALHKPKPSYDEQRKVIALVKRTFRGRAQDKLVQIESATYKADYFLISRSQEISFCYSNLKLPIKIFPLQMELPPLMKELRIHESKINGVQLTKNIKMNIVYNKTGFKNYHIEKPGERTTEPELLIELGKSITPKLYESINL